MRQQKIDQKDINNAAWSACDTFRGVVDPAQYKDYILVMLFLKYISDVWQDHYETYQKQYGDDDERIRRKLKRERFILPMITLTEMNEKSGKKSAADAFPATYYPCYGLRGYVKEFSHNGIFPLIGRQGALWEY
ncbi:type I restriction-modification protein subunit M [Candidatus Magnetomorum sp. HK-1]|nr:type I restriction-modification protein subunit M [Candidatus Magnetomorum sp. HK-1]